MRVKKAKALWAMKAAKDRSEENYDAARKEDISGKNKDTSGFVGRAPQRPNPGLGKSIKVLGELLLRLAIGSKRLVESRVDCDGLQFVGTKILRKMREGPFWEGVWPCMDPWDSVHLLERPGKVWAACRALFLSIKKEPVVATKNVSSNSFVSAETLKACALVGLHLLATEGAAGSSAGQSPDLGDTWRQGCPKSLVWIGSCSTSETSLG